MVVLIILILLISSLKHNYCSVRVVERLVIVLVIGFIKKRLGCWYTNGKWTIIHNKIVNSGTTSILKKDPA